MTLELNGSTITSNQNGTAITVSGGELTLTGGDDGVVRNCRGAQRVFRE